MRRSSTIDRTITEQDSIVILDDTYYKLSGAMKVLGVGRNSILNSIKDGTLEVLRHPSGYLFSKEALEGWISSHSLNRDKKRK